MKKKILVIALAAMLLVTCLLPCAAFAVESTNEQSATFSSSFFEQDVEALKSSDMYYEDRIWNENKNLIQGWREIKFEYLERIPGTPLAELKCVELFLPCIFYSSLPPYSEYYSQVEKKYEYILYSDFFEVLNLSSFGVLQSNLKEIVYRGTNSEGIPVFRAVYYNAYYLCAKDADGGFKNFYVNCNQTLRQYVEPDLESELLPQDALDVFVNDLYIQFYDSLGTRDIMDLYGYWCFVAIPEGNIFNEFFQTIGTGTFLSPNVNFFQFNIVLDYDKNNELQKDYGKTTLGAILNLYGKIFKKPTASCFLLYLNGGDSTVLITQNGSTDLDNNGGAGLNGTVDFISNIDWGSGLAVMAAVAFAVLIIILILKFGKRKGR